MTTNDGAARLLVTVELPDPVLPASLLLEGLGSLAITVLGWYPVPDQTSPEQARDRFGEDAEDALTALAERLRGEGVQDVEWRSVFTKDLSESVARVAESSQCVAVLAPRPVEEIRELLLPIHADDQPLERIARFTAALIGGREIEVHMLCIGGQDEQAAEERAIEALVGCGVPREVIQRQSAEADDPVDAVEDVDPSDYDVIVLGESKQTTRERFFGRIHERIVRESDCPVMVVLRPADEDDGDGATEGET